MEMIVDENKFINKIIENLYGLLIIIYICNILGLCAKFYFRIPDSLFLEILLIMFPTTFYIAFAIFNIRHIRKINNDDELSGSQKLTLMNYIDDYFFKDIGLRYHKLAIVLCFSFFFSIFYPGLNKTSLVDFTCYIIIIFSLSVSFMYLLLYNWDNENMIKNSAYGQIIYWFFLIFGVIFKLKYNVFINFFNIIVSHINDYFSLSLTIILLGATLSLLAFTYNMVLTNEEGEKKENMKKNGEKFFIATLFSMLFLILIFLLSIFCNFSNVLLYGNINFLDKVSFINVNIFIILLLVLLTTLILSLKYVLSGIFSSLNNLFS